MIELKRHLLPQPLCQPAIRAYAIEHSSSNESFSVLEPLKHRAGTQDFGQRPLGSTRVVLPAPVSPTCPMRRVHVIRLHTHSRLVVVSSPRTQPKLAKTLRHAGLPSPNRRQMPICRTS